MAYIKKLKDNELIGGTDNTDVYPVTSTEAVYNKENVSQEYINNHVDGSKIVNGTITNNKIADSTISIGKLDNDVQTKIQQGTQRAWAPKGNYSAETVYNVNDLVYYPDTNSSYISLQANNQGHSPVWQSATGGWWMMVLDGSYLNVMVEELEQAIAQAIEDAQEDIADAIAGANTAAQSANTAAANAEAKIDWVEEQVESLVAYEVDDKLDETSIIPVQNKVLAPILVDNKNALPSVSTGVYKGLRNANAIVGSTFDYSRESTSSTSRCGYIAVEEGDVLTITMNSGSYYRTCVLLDSNNVVTWTSGQGNTSNRVVTVPSGSVRFAFNYDSTKTVVLKKKVTIDDTVEELVETMPTKADKSILAGITPKVFTPSNTNHTWDYSNGVLAVTTNVAGIGYAVSVDMPSHTKPWTLTFKARMVNGDSQTLHVGLCSSYTGNNTKAITINSAEWTNFNITGTGDSSFNLGFTIPDANAIVGNVFEIKDIVMMSDYVKIPINTLERLDALDEEVDSKITTRTWEVSCNNGINALYVGLRIANAVVGNTFNYSTENRGYSSGYIDVEEGDIIQTTLTSLNSQHYFTGVVLDANNKITRVLGRTYSGTLTIATNEVRIAYSCQRTSNDKFVITRQLVNVVEELMEEVEGKAASAYGKVFTFNTDAFLQGCDRYSKYLIKIGCCGDSLTANGIGGDIPVDVDEGSAQTRPMRLLTNNIPRRLYDLISWNKPTWRRLDHSAWSRNGFTYQYYDLFRGINPGYWQSIAAGSYAQITVPQGMEHFALVCRQMKNGGTLNVTINGQTPGTYSNPYYTSKVAENTVVTSDIVPATLPIGPATIDLSGVTTGGNFYHVVQFNNLPSGQDNVIRFETASAAQCDIWGGFYWSGNTCVVMNLGHGGHTSTQLINWLTDEVYNEDYDAIFFEVPEMNNTRLSIEQTKADITSISNRLRNMNVDHCFTSCNILGLSIIHDTNFYETSPTQLEINDAVRELLSSLGEPFIDIFQYFRWHTERRGGTLAGGQAGLWYTEDGQHGNPAGVKLWFDCLKKVILNKAIMIE